MGEIDELQSGIDLDELVAAKVLGWDIVQINYVWGLSRWDVTVTWAERGTHGKLILMPDGVPRFSTDISAAWRVCAHFRKQDSAEWDLKYALFKESLETSYGSKALWEMDEQEAATFICKTALMAVGFEF